mgnify:CR=1 FL=1
MWPRFDYILLKYQSYKNDIYGHSKIIKYESNSSVVFNIKLRTLHMTSYNGNNYRRKEAVSEIIYCKCWIIEGQNCCIKHTEMHENRTIMPRSCSNIHCDHVSWRLLKQLVTIMLTKSNLKI